MSLQNPLNRYTCDTCRSSIVTVDRDEGVTPFMLGCRASPGCPGMMQSSFYRDVRGAATFEWRKLTPEQLIKASPAMREHARMGGLDIFRL